VYSRRSKAKEKAGVLGMWYLMIQARIVFGVWCLDELVDVESNQDMRKKVKSPSRRLEDSKGGMLQYIMRGLGRRVR